MEDPVRQLPAVSEPRQLRLEDACRERQQSRQAFVASHLGERTKDMVADGEARSQRRASKRSLPNAGVEAKKIYKSMALRCFSLKN